jgi:hypothetical protein
MNDQGEPVKKQRRLTDLWHSTDSARAKVNNGDVEAPKISAEEMTSHDGAGGDVDLHIESASAVELPVSLLTVTVPNIDSSQVQASCSTSAETNNICASAAYNDIGLAVGKILSSEERVKFVIPWKPSSEEEYPSSERRDKNSVTKNGVQRRRRLLPRHLETFPWLAVSKVTDGAFCVPCVLFTSDAGVGGRSQGHGQQTGILVRRPLNRFYDITGKGGILISHQNTVYHQNATIALDNFRAACIETRELDIRS